MSVSELLDADTDTGAETDTAADADGASDDPLDDDDPLGLPTLDVEDDDALVALSTALDEAIAAKRL